MSEQHLTRTRRPVGRAVLLAASLAALAVVVAPSGAASAGETRPGYQIPLYADSAAVASSSVVPAATTARSGRAANITVTYTGFSDAAKASFQRAVNIWKSTLNSGVTIKVAARYANLGSPNLLGSAGPTTVHANFPGAPKQNVWYVAAAANKRRGADLNGATAEINANFNSAFSNWHFGSGAPPANKYDFETVVLHELGHGVGFLSGIYQSGSQIRWDIAGSNPGYPLVTGTYVVNSANKALTTFANGSTGLKAAATSNQVYFNGPLAKQANGGAKPRMYAPGTWQQGSSLSHWNEATYGRGNPHSLMTPQLGLGERILNPGAFTVGALKDSGW
jgi:hypothetical protein